MLQSFFKVGDKVKTAGKEKLNFHYEYGEFDVVKQMFDEADREFTVKSVDYDVDGKPWYMFKESDRWTWYEELLVANPKQYEVYKDRFNNTVIMIAYVDENDGRILAISTSEDFGWTIGNDIVVDLYGNGCGGVYNIGEIEYVPKDGLSWVTAWWYPPGTPASRFVRLDAKDYVVKRETAEDEKCVEQVKDDAVIGFDGTLNTLPHLTEVAATLYNMIKNLEKEGTKITVIDGKVTIVNSEKKICIELG